MDLCHSRESNSGTGGIDPNDIQAQVDEIYAHILASVDVSLDEEKKPQQLYYTPTQTLRPTSNTICGGQRRATASATTGLTCGPRAKVHSRCRLSEPTEISAITAATTTPTVDTHDDVEPMCGCSSSSCSCYPKHAQQQQQQQQRQQPCRWASTALGATRGQRIATSSRMVSIPPDGHIRSRAAVSGQAKPSTFGSGRKGMSEPVCKSSAPGPGSYFRTENTLPVARESHGTSQQMERAQRGVQSSKMENKTRQEQFALLCQCYWKQFPELEMPTNAAAHASNCPCQNICPASPHDHSSSSSRSNSRDSMDSISRQCGGVMRSARRAQSSGRKGMQKGAVFGTSPRQTLFAKPTDEDRRKLLVSSPKGIPLKEEQKILSCSNTKPIASPRGGLSSILPGPGAYNVPSAFDAASLKGKRIGVSIGRAPREMHKASEAPGPGSYDTDTTKSVESGGQLKKSYFLSSSPRQLQLVSSAEKAGKSGPGPGEYRVEDTARTNARHKNAPAFSFGRAKLPEAGKTLFTSTGGQEDGPGPGAYDLSGPRSDGGVRMSGRATVMTTARRDDNMWRGAHFDKDDIPGPGTYILPEEKKGPAYSLRARPAERLEPSPGPGHYEIPDGAKGPQWSLTTRRPPTSFPSLSAQAEMPGPGEYFVPVFDLRREHSPAPLFGTAPRMLNEEIKSTAMVPGPGTYDVQSMAGGLSSTRSPVMGTASRQTNLLNSIMDESTPGPGTYVAQYTTQERRAAVPVLAPGSARFDIAGSALNVAETPGPGYYDMDAQVSVANRRGAVLGSAPRVSLFDATSATHAGPGAYDIPIPKHGPSFSMRQRVPEPIAEPTPGPGLYFTKDTMVNQGCLNVVLGTADRFPMSIEERAKVDVPGPGSYIVAERADGSAGPAAVFGTSPRQLSPTQTQDINALGPGSYDPQLVRGNVPGATWGTESRFTDVENRCGDAPGPGAYEVGGGMSSSSARGAVIGTTGNRSTMDWMISADAASMPGPGSYLPQFPQEHQGSVVFGSAPQHTLSPAEREARTNTVLGPGAYEAQIPHAHTFHASFGTSVRPDEKPGTSIGPGHYSPTNPNATSPKSLPFGTAPRLPQRIDSNDVPGPGSYEPNMVTRAEGSSVTFPAAQRFLTTDASGNVLRQDETTPGPGSYEVNGELARKGGAVVFGTAAREANQVERERAMLPGPGQYQTSSKATETAAPAYAFGKEVRMPEGVAYGNVPGPGTYDVIVPTFTAPTTRFGTEKREVGPMFLAEVPGPGTYDAAAMNAALGGVSPAHRFSTAEREMHPTTDAKSLPGPGQYNTDIKNAWQGSSAITFSTSPRFPGMGMTGNSGVDEANVSPGPGQYTPSHPEWKAGPVYSFPMTCREDPGVPAVEANLPGPGTYDPKPIPLIPSPSPTFGTEARRFPEVQGDPNHPGPGYYNPQLQPDGPYIRFGTAERGITPGTKTCGDDHPGPGAYDVAPSAPDGPAYSIHGTAQRGPTLMEVERSQLPGPGAYSVMPSFPSQDAVSFVKAVRFQIPGEQDLMAQPGPGYYDPHPLETKVGPTMGRVPRLAEISRESEHPGPGHYNPGGANDLIPLDGGVAMRFTAARFNDKEAGEGIPGPASYNIGDPRSATAGPSFPQAPRLAELCGDPAAFPGPGEYSLPSPLENIKGAYSFGSGQRVCPGEGAENVPGPGTYDSGTYLQRFMSGPAFSLQGKPLYQDTMVDNPGPGSYNPRPIDTTRAVSFGVLPSVDPDAVFESRVNAVPGPAAYVIPSSLSNHAVGIGSAARYAATPTENTVGPGAYLTGGPVVLPSHSSYSFGYAPRPDVVSQDARQIPGPGAYHHPFEPRPNAPVFTFGGAERFSDMAPLDSVGPGQYFRQEGDLTGPAISFPIDSRPPRVKIAESGGPGEYNQSVQWRSTDRGPTLTATRGLNPSLPVAPTPGPGAYRPETVHRPGKATTTTTTTRDTGPERCTVKSAPLQTDKGRRGK